VLQLKTASLGIASVRAGDQEPSELIERADAAMYAVKGAGRNQSKLWTEELNASAIR
jgi:PleD family two-component response regulator